METFNDSAQYYAMDRMDTAPECGLNANHVKYCDMYMRTVIITQESMEFYS